MGEHSDGVAAAKVTLHDKNSVKPFGLKFYLPATRKYLQIPIFVEHSRCFPDTFVKPSNILSSRRQILSIYPNIVLKQGPQQFDYSQQSLPHVWGVDFPSVLSVGKAMEEVY